MAASASCLVVVDWGMKTFSMGNLSAWQILNAVSRRGICPFKILLRCVVGSCDFCARSTWVHPLRSKIIGMRFEKFIITAIETKINYVISQ